MDERVTLVSCSSVVNTFEEMIKEHNSRRNDLKEALIKMAIFTAVALYANYRKA